jgi:hypothetical protein
LAAITALPAQRKVRRLASEKPDQKPGQEACSDRGLSLDELKLLNTVLFSRLSLLHRRQLLHEAEMERALHDEDGKERGENKKEFRRLVAQGQLDNWQERAGGVGPPWGEVLKASAVRAKDMIDWYNNELYGDMPEMHADPSTGMTQATMVKVVLRERTTVSRHVAYQGRLETSQNANAAREVFKLADVSKPADAKRLKTQAYGRTAGTINFPLQGPKAMLAVERAAPQALGLPLRRPPYVAQLLCTCGGPMTLKFVAKQTTSSVHLFNESRAEVALVTVIFRQGRPVAVTVCAKCTKVETTWEASPEGALFTSQHAALQGPVDAANQAAAARKRPAVGLNQTKRAQCPCSECLRQLMEIDGEQAKPAEVTPAQQEAGEPDRGKSQPDHDPAPTDGDAPVRKKQKTPPVMTSYRFTFGKKRLYQGLFEKKLLQGCMV